VKLLIFKQVAQANRGLTIRKMIISLVVINKGSKGGYFVGGCNALTWQGRGNINARCATDFEAIKKLDQNTSEIL
jgi:hypothetical protein